MKGKEQQTIDRFLHIFNLAGQHLHSPNPLGFETLAEFHERRQASREELKVELVYLKGILWEHVKLGLPFDPSADEPRDIASPENAWLVYFGRADVEDIQMAAAKGVRAD